MDGVTAKKFVLMAYDFIRTYDAVDHRMLKLKLLRLGLPACPVRWVWAFLRDRRGVSGGERRPEAGAIHSSVGSIL